MALFGQTAFITKMECKGSLKYIRAVAIAPRRIRLHDRSVRRPAASTSARVAEGCSARGQINLSHFWPVPIRQQEGLSRSGEASGFEGGAPGLHGGFGEPRRAALRTPAFEGIERLLISAFG